MRPHVRPYRLQSKSTSHCSSLKLQKCRRRFHFKRCRVRSHFVRNFTDTAYIISISVLTHSFLHLYETVQDNRKTDGETYRPTFLPDSIKICSAKAPTLPFTVSAGDVNNIKFILRITEVYRRDLIYYPIPEQSHIARLFLCTLLPLCNSSTSYPFRQSRPVKKKKLPCHRELK